ncbi:MAG: M90 family metallopeptidase [Pseudomonadota bacterium]
MPWLGDFYRRWLARRRPLGDADWHSALAHCRYARSLPPNDRQRLRELTVGFLNQKAIDGAHDLSLTAGMRALIAVRACIPILNLGIDFYREWYGMIVYPGDFRVRHEYTDEAGVMHRGWRELCGESMEQGPIVLSWETLATDEDYVGCDLVVHECAHKLDILNGPADGFPPLHAGMDPVAWTRTFTEAYTRMNAALDENIETALDPYAASDPAEFFAVASETFFSAPWLLQEATPGVYAALATFYRQDTGRWLSPP